MRSRRNPLTEVLTVRFSTATKERLDQAAEHEDITLGELIRRAVAYYLSKEQT
jgi:predicted transcriptional regulator